MDKTNYFGALFKLLPDYRKIVLLVFLIKKDADFLRECGFLEKDINRLNEEFMNKLLEQKNTILITLKMKKNLLS